MLWFGSEMSPKALGYLGTTMAAVRGGQTVGGLM